MTMIYANCNLVTQKKEAGGIWLSDVLPENTRVTGYKALKNGIFLPVFNP